MENLALILANATFQHSDDCPMMRGFRYSGRGMVGGECPGFNLDSLTDMLTFGMLIGKVVEQVGGDLGEDLAKNARTDNLGLGFVLYFPNTSWEDYEREFTDMRTGIDGTDPNDEEEEDCGHDFNEFDICKICGEPNNN